jgi:hypothetical protein
MKKAGAAAVGDVPGAFVLDEFDQGVVHAELGASGGAIQYSKAEEAGVVGETAVEVADLEPDSADVGRVGEAIVRGGLADSRESGVGSR